MKKWNIFDPRFIPNSCKNVNNSVGKIGFCWKQSNKAGTHIVLENWGSSVCRSLWTRRDRKNSCPHGHVMLSPTSITLSIPSPSTTTVPLTWSLMLRSHHLQKLYRSVQLPVTLMIWGWLNNFCLKIFKDLLNFLQTTTGSIFTHKIKLLIQQIKAPISKTLNTLWNGSMAAV